MATAKIKESVTEICSLERRNLHRKVRINACFDVALLLACSHHCASLLGIGKSLRGVHSSKIACVAFSLMIFRMPDGPACMIALHDISRTWVVPLQRAFSSQVAITAGCHALQVCFDKRPFTVCGNWGKCQVALARPTCQCSAHRA